MEYLHDEGYYTATLEELEKYVLGEISLPEKSIVITFDDGYQNNYIYAYPILKKYGFHGTIFMIGGEIKEQTVSFDPKKKSSLSRAEIEASRDVFEYHSHTFDLHKKGFPKCGESHSLALDTALLQQDIQKIKSTGIDTPYIAYPYGEVSMQMIYYLRENGYRMGFTVLQDFVKPGDPLMKLPRLTVTSKTNLPELLEHKITPKEAMNMNSMNSL
ncbi:polysaccharide deacetylase family protein [Paenibacillus sp. D2_2]|uniref:polysaccharide deacetylase family protein n=1 Tax=Paenibacillus sp. D2_2 TaxID=3073092 RepID=UPI00281543BE|nr:polysaccharide deacetylase family protein [Paenibacillus sp. D2_2]WMT39209.1 polysaccharide deacetylase family protein [Paenibacillus sp. D2_2]